MKHPDDTNDVKDLGDHGEDGDAYTFRSWETHKVTCKTCGYFMADAPHSWGDDNKCTWCHADRTQHVHDFYDWVIDQAATTEAAGSKHRTCKVCGYTETAEIPKLETQYEVPAPTLNISDTTCKSAVLKFAKDEKANSYAVMIDGKQAIYDNNASSESDTGYVMVYPRSLNTIMSSDTETYTFTVFALNETGEQIGNVATFEYCPNHYHNETVKSEANC